MTAPLASFSEELSRLENYVDIALTHPTIQDKVWDAAQMNFIVFLNDTNYTFKSKIDLKNGVKKDIVEKVRKNGLDEKIQSVFKGRVAFKVELFLANQEEAHSIGIDQNIDSALLEMTKSFEKENTLYKKTYLKQRFLVKPEVFVEASDEEESEDEVEESGCCVVQ